LGEVLRQSGPQRIEVDVTDQLQEVGVLLADDGLIAILEEMARPVVSQVEINGVPGKEPAHERPETGHAWPEQKVNVIGHQRPGEAVGAVLDEEFRETPKKAPTVAIVPEDIATADASNDDVLQEVGQIYAGRSWHRWRLAAQRALVNK
jgi:hypothetical protein